METKILETPVDKHKVELKSWITGADKRKLKKPFFDNVKMSIEGITGEQKFENLDMAKVMEEAENILIETIVVSINGEKEKILEKILEMKEKDYNFVIQEINKIANDESFTKPSLIQ